MILCFHCESHFGALITNYGFDQLIFGTNLVFSQMVHFFTFSLPRVAVESVACKAHVVINVRYLFGTYLVFFSAGSFFYFLPTTGCCRKCRM
jgi:hypothetical protein